MIKTEQDLVKTEKLECDDSVDREALRFEDLRLRPVPCQHRRADDQLRRAD